MVIKVPTIEMVCREGRYSIPNAIEFNFVSNVIRILCGEGCGSEKKCKSKKMEIKFEK